MTNTTSDSEKDLDIEMTESNSPFHFKNMRKYVNAIEQFTKSMEVYKPSWFGTCF